ncbi:MAG: hypothetical protein R6V84_09825 [Desulfobacterales bacterium]
MSEEEKREMLIDARDPERRAVFAAARKISQEGSLDDYIDFLSENMALVPSSTPRKHVTKDFRL